MGEVEHRRSDAPMDVVLEMSTEVTPKASKTAGATKFTLIDRKENRQRRRRSEAPATPSDSNSGMERTMHQQAQQLRQLH